MEQVIQLVVNSFFLAAVCIFVNMQWQACYGFSQNSYTGINSSGLHGGSFINGFATGGATKKETVCATE